MCQNPNPSAPIDPDDPSALSTSSLLHEVESYNTKLSRKRRYKPVQVHKDFVQALEADDAIEEFDELEDDFVLKAMKDAVDGEEKGEEEEEEEDEWPALDEEDEFDDEYEDEEETKEGDRKRRKQGEEDENENEDEDWEEEDEEEDIYASHGREKTTLDEAFEHMLENEYDDEQMGELDEMDPEILGVTDEVDDDALDEFMNRKKKVKKSTRQVGWKGADLPLVFVMKLFF